ncbi:SMP-30/gluconolactonase/LRE family protein [Mesorhizobium mediterraneum]|uniref:Gluconolaconase n=1 Tax=Mesorhizobium mediterraneum TaxID=43617 RepID=A0AB36R2R9_9HYPH|nr:MULTISPECIES: SMP-30/gluconolactonase/LRE family protein [Mesorhizobium]PAP98963.1 gluconolaconase [Mesorhizobium mediterraneum]RUU40005.1 gluconolaconase [Mesorhizobium sp. M6A.T.Ce.TU.002.03.1.1]RWN37001.1 MAG: gluconolaconase [Mesorhizobium sp.]RWN66491.1 MAG: gluconolaconase [Mesorhizobium sp.]RWP70201.1 MAG: gluconolaconase [Mesorhizobium sp.]
MAKPLLEMAAARVFFDGIFTSPRVAHPEGVAVNRDGSIWCGTETGDLLRLSADGGSAERMGGTEGFLLGIAFDSAGNCFACDLKHSAIFRWNAGTGLMERFASAGIRVPNYPIVDETRGWLYVSDSAGEDNRSGIFRYDLKTGEGRLWCREPMAFANGMTMAPDGSGLYVVESNAACISYVPILADGAAGARQIVVDGVDNVPDGLAFAPDGSLFISCYEPSRIYRWRQDRGLEVLIEDPAATTLAHPTNIAFKGDKLYTANLGRWHITEIDLATIPN